MQKNIAYLGIGAWGFCLASLLAKQGHLVKMWSHRSDIIQFLSSKKEHPKFPGVPISPNLSFSNDLTATLDSVDLIIESVSSQGIRPVCNQIKDSITSLSCPFVLTSKGIEQDSQLLLSEIAQEILGPESTAFIGSLSGPSIAGEVMKGLPCSVVCSSYNPDILPLIQETFSSESFRVYPNADIKGVELGGALKNVIAIAAGISDGMNLGYNAKSGLVTRGLHEIRKLGRALGCKDTTITGLSGMGDLCVTCFCGLSRNYSFGQLLAQGTTVESAKEQIGMVVEGAYTVVSAMQMAATHHIDMPIIKGIFNVIYKKQSSIHALKLLLSREIKEEHL
ncbi:Glycerol-3-phosphate dehydrogenase [NAD(P)+] [Candidatus Clavichlamydia salmonicola]|uniref:NAD(P)H-dependent glycerol-3-phosphate dehydrogenase n=1 Tax=Candidatus Clavichlamydia salmonicola TaxID=469812 RepID=UPI0018918719|nr:NAD(P)H-dependent glycerol-3-phosphate dehydrogenase [Candidatus Clavichlamydia salmonicola]MBF5050538.1 Glycerol-3-phosphate dehydrogenase [NAD(P)+] [Candidatus Clavichlamydia salmonicola]